MTKYGFWHGVRGIVSGACAGVGLGGIAAYVFLIWPLLKHAPRNPDSASGAVYDYNNHGIHHYLTIGQFIEAHMVLGFLGLLFLAGWIGPKVNFRWVFMGARWNLYDPHRFHTTARTVIAIGTFAGLILYHRRIFEWLGDLWLDLTAG